MQKRRGIQNTVVYEAQDLQAVTNLHEILGNKATIFNLVMFGDSLCRRYRKGDLELHVEAIHAEVEDIMWTDCRGRCVLGGRRYTGRRRGEVK